MCCMALSPASPSLTPSLSQLLFPPVSLHLSTSSASHSELWWVGHMFSVSVPSGIDFPTHPPAKSWARSAVDLTERQHRHLRCCSVSLRCVSQGPAAHWIMLSHSHTQTHTNTWAQRAIISPAVYFKRLAVLEKNTHYNLAVHNCSVARAGGIKGIWVHWARRPDRQDGTTCASFISHSGECYVLANELFAFPVSRFIYK